MWTVYVHTNEQNGKQYVGVTSKGVAGRWERVLSKAQEIRNLVDVASRDAYLGPRAKKQLLKLSGTLEYDVAMGVLQWRHDEVMSTNNLIIALIKERELINQKGCLRPIGYNRSSGGEIPPYTNVVDVLRWAKELSAVPRTPTCAPC